MQRALVEEVLATGTPVVLVLLTGRPYAVDWALERCAAVVQAFFPGEEGSPAVAGVLSGRVNPSGHLPVSLPRSAGAQPFVYLHPALGGDTDVSNVSTLPARPFGYGLSYTAFELADLRATAATTADPVRAAVRVTNTGDRAGATVVQLYGHDPLASVARPVAQLLGFHRVTLEPGAVAELVFTVPPARLAFIDRAGDRVVEPGELRLWVGQSVADRAVEAVVDLGGGVYPVGLDRRASYDGHGGPRLSLAAGLRQSGAQEARSTIEVGSWRWLDTGGRSSSSPTRMLSAAAPISRIGWLIVVSGGTASADSGTLSKPMTERSSGTRSPSSWATWMVRIAERSLAAKMAVGRSGRVSSSRAGASALSGR